MRLCNQNSHTRPWPLPEPRATTVHHVSDLHVGYRPWFYKEGDHVQRDVLQGLIPEVDGFVITGDITDNATAAEATYAKSWMTAVAKGQPSLWVPGNHDLRYPTVTRSSWESQYGRAGNNVAEIPGYRLVGFTADKNTWKEPGDEDSPWTIPQATWEWMDQQCSTSTNPVILCCHYPPWELNFNDHWSIQNKVTLANFITDHPNVAGMLVGHMHWHIEHAKSNYLLEIGNRTKFPIIMGTSAMLSISGLEQDKSARIPSITKYVSFYEERWEIRHRLHGPRAWGGPFGYRMTTLHMNTGLISHSMG